MIFVPQWSFSISRLILIVGSVRISRMDAAIISRIAHDVNLPETSVAATIELFEKGATAAFIVHYRKEVTGGMNESNVRAVQERHTYYREILDRQASILKLISDQGKLTEDLRARIQSSLSRVELEDFFHQFRPKKRTRATEAIERGLEPLAEYLWNQEPDAWGLQEHIDVFVDPAKKVASREQALQGATDIIAQWISENLDFRKTLREMLWSEGSVVSTVVPAKAQQKTKYNMYYDRREPVTTIPSHRVLAIRRGSKEGILTSSIEGNHAKAIEFLLNSVIRDKESVFAPVLEVAVRESYNRILRPLIETEVRAQLKERADREAIRVFQENLANLLLSAPAGPMVVAGLDMIKSGECTLAVVDEKGGFLEECALRFAAPKAPPPRTPQVRQVAQQQTADVMKPTDAAAPPAAEAAPATSPEIAIDAAVISGVLETAPLIAPAPVEPDIEASAALLTEMAPKSEVSAATESVPETVPASVTETVPDAEATPVAESVPETKAALVIEVVPEVEATPHSEVAPGTEAAPLTGTVPETGETPAMEPPPEVEVAVAAGMVPEQELVTEAVEASPEAQAAPAETAVEITQAEPAEAPHAPPPIMDYIAKARATIRELIAKHAVRAIAIGSGTGARELEATLRQILAEEKIENVLVAAVNDAGIAVYSSSRVAREELPDLAVSARCALSLARRLQDPLAELVKIDPKLIGVGQYQHDVDQKELHRGLLQTVQFCVNNVAVDVNTAGYSLLRYVSGLNERLAHRIVGFRNANGPFPSRQALFKIPGFDSSAFERAAGFLRIRGAENPLDGTAVHPESYPVVERMAAALGVGVVDLVGNKDRILSFKLEEFANETVGLPTLYDIREELLRPGRDPRRTFTIPRFRSDVRDLNDLKKGMTVEGTVTNVTNFGAFVDIGVRQDGLVHLSQMSNRFIRDPREAVKVGDVVQVKVISVEVETKRIGLSMKALLPFGSRRRKRPRRPGGRAPQTEAASKTDATAVPGEPSEAAPRSNASSPGPERRRRRDHDHGRPRRRNNRRLEKATQAAPTEPKPQVPEPTLQEKIAILQSKFRGIN